MLFLRPRVPARKPHRIELVCALWALPGEIPGPGETCVPPIHEAILSINAPTCRSALPYQLKDLPGTCRGVPCLKPRTQTRAAFTF